MSVTDAIACALIAAPALVCICLAVAGALDDQPGGQRPGSDRSGEGPVTTPRLIEDLKRDEGLRLHAYPDPRTGAEPWTCGYGCTGPDVGPGTVWTQAEAEAALARRVGETEAGLDRAIGWWRRLDGARQDVLANMAYNLGVQGLMAFEAVLAHARAGRYALAADAMLRSAWAREVGPRARRLAQQMRAPPSAAGDAGGAQDPGGGR